MAKKKMDAAKGEPVETVVDIEALSEDPSNARLHDDENMATILGSLTTFDQVHPLVVQKSSMRVIAGNGRLAAMRKLGWTKCRALVVEWDDERCKAFSLVDNRSAEQGKWDYRRLADVAMELDAGGIYDMGKLGFSEDFMGPVMSGEVFAEDHHGEDGAEEHGERPKHGKPIQLTPEQREVFDQACARIREVGREDYSEGRCLELLCGDYLAAA